MAGLRSEKLKRGIQLVQGGVSYRRAAMIVGVSHGSLHATMTRHGIEHPKRARDRAPHLDMAASLVEQGGTFRDVAELFNTTPSNIFRACKTRGIKSVRPRQSEART